MMKTKISNYHENLKRIAMRENRDFWRFFSKTVKIIKKDKIMIIWCFEKRNWESIECKTQFGEKRRMSNGRGNKYFKLISIRIEKSIQLWKAFKSHLFWSPYDCTALYWTLQYPSPSPLYKTKQNKHTDSEHKHRNNNSKAAHCLTQEEESQWSCRRKPQWSEHGNQDEN